MKTFCCEMCRVAAGESRTTMIVCPTCGNKRCPRAEYHENKCNGSNEPGPQRGPASVPQIEAQLIHNRRELKASEAAERPGEADKTCLCGHAKSKHNCGKWRECVECGCENFVQDPTEAIAAKDAEIRRLTERVAELEQIGVERLNSMITVGTENAKLREQVEALKPKAIVGGSDVTIPKGHLIVSPELGAHITRSDPYHTFIGVTYIDYGIPEFPQHESERAK